MPARRNVNRGATTTSSSSQNSTSTTTNRPHTWSSSCHLCGSLLIVSYGTSQILTCQLLLDSRVYHSCVCNMECTRGQKCHNPFQGYFMSILRLIVQRPHRKLMNFQLFTIGWHELCHAIMVRNQLQAFLFLFSSYLRTSVGNPNWWDSDQNYHWSKSGRMYSGWRRSPANYPFSRLHRFYHHRRRFSFSWLGYSRRQNL